MARIARLATGWSLILLVMVGVGESRAWGESSETDRKTLALPLDVFLTAYLRGSEQSKLVAADYAARELPLLRSESGFDPTVRAQGSVADSTLESASPLAPKKVETQSLVSSAAKVFSTGTVTSAEIGLKQSKAPGESIETTTGVSVRQRLWRDAFGAAGRDRIASARVSVAQARDDASARLEKIAVQAIGEYHRAWTLQKQIESGRERVARQERLLSVSRRKQQLGTMESADFLQVETSLLAVRDNVLDLENDLGDLWRALVIGAGLENASFQPGTLYREVDPMRVGLEVASDASAIARMCREGAPKAEGSASIRSQQKQIEALDLTLSSVRSTAKPDLFVEARYGTNGIDAKFGDSFEEATGQTKRQLTLALGIEATLGGDGDKAQIMEAARAKARAEILLAQEKSSLSLRWQNACDDARRLQRRMELLEQSGRKFSDRVRAESRRFDLGKADVSAVIRAEDDLASNDLTNARVQAEFSLLSWTIRELSGELSAVVEGAIP